MQALTGGIGGLFSAFAGSRSMPNGPGPGPTFDILAGQQQQQAYDTQAKELGEQSSYAYFYGLESAAQNDYNVTRFKASQEAQFSASGVDIKGSPLAILTETQTRGDQVSQMIMQRANLESNLYSEQGLQALRSGAFAAFSGQANADIANYNYKLQRAQAGNAAIGAGIQGVGAIASGIGGFFGGRNSGGSGYPSPNMVP